MNRKVSKVIDRVFYRNQGEGGTCSSVTRFHRLGRNGSRRLVILSFVMKKAVPRNANKLKGSRTFIQNAYFVSVSVNY